MTGALLDKSESNRERHEPEDTVSMAQCSRTAPAATLTNVPLE